MDKLIYKTINLRENTGDKLYFYEKYINLIKAIDMIIVMRKNIAKKYLSSDELKIYEYILKINYLFLILFASCLINKNLAIA